jgi:hypothetical protein
VANSHNVCQVSGAGCGCRQLGSTIQV